MSKSSNLLRLAAMAGLLALAGCATPTPYAPAGQYQEGYTDRQLAENRWRVTFTGNSVTPRDQVEDYLMLRAAEVTLASGHNFFRFDTRDTQTQTRSTAFNNYYMGGPGAFWGRGWGFGPRWGGYYPYGGYFGGGFGYGGFGYGTTDIVTTNRYQAFAEIVVLTDDQAKDDPRAVDAKSVVRHLAPPPPPPRN